MKHPIATVVLIVLILAILPYLPIMNYEESKHVDPDKSTEDPGLPLIDSDGDRMPDNWELAYGLNPFDARDADYDDDFDGWDFDRDGFVEGGAQNETFTNLEEYLRGTQPNNTDSDGDGMWDGWEEYYGFDPLEPADADDDADHDGFDADHDNVIEEDEAYTNLMEFHNDTNPRSPDTDGDLMWDGWEVYYELDPLDPKDRDEDPDEDGFDRDRKGGIRGNENFTNYEEFLKKTHPKNNDTDGDGIIDGWEAFYFDQALANPGDLDIYLNADQLSPLDDSGRDKDLDGDLLPNYEEYKNPKFDVDNYTHTSPIHNDSDGDGLLDGWEVYQKYHNQAALDPTTNDTDKDGMPDGWEIHWDTGWLADDGLYYFLDPNNRSDANIDQEPDGWDVDRDGDIDGYELFTNVEEYRKGANPFLTDSDGDGMPDGFEAAFQLDPSRDDSLGDKDGDSFNAYREMWGLPEVEGGIYNNIMEYNNGENWTDPSSNDTQPPDGDGMWDGWEVYYGFNPLDPTDANDDPDEDGYDFDHDGQISENESFTNLEEFQNGTDPFDPDTDGDGMPDGWEAHYGLDPLLNDSALDLDGDTITNYEEWTNDFHDVDDIIPMDPSSNDTDEDGILDQEEIILGEDGFITDPTAPDTDFDGIPDGWEVDHGLDPTNESDAGEDPDKDGAYLDLDFDGVYDYNDYDGDDRPDPYPYTNLMEYENGTDLYDPDSDMDTMWDGWETFHGLDPLSDDDWDQDKDMDGVINHEEFNSTLLISSDTDGFIYTDPSVGDTDYDGLTDFEELNFTNPTDPTNFDTDFDEMDDGWEVKYFLDPRDPTDAKDDNDLDSYDVNGNGVLAANEYYSNLDEYYNRTNPLVADTDEDGIWDVWEAYYRWITMESPIPEIRNMSQYFNPLDPDDASAHTDADGLNNSLEFLNPVDYDGRLSTDPLEEDTDGDGIDDFDEMFGTVLLQFHGIYSDPTNYDTDGDGMWDGWESNYTYGWVIPGELGRHLLNATDPLDGSIDTDNDGHDLPWIPEAYREFSNLQEFVFWVNNPEYYCNPFDPDSLIEGYTDGFIAYLVDHGGGA